jgi:superfamily II DNA/RNA helicase
LHRTGRTGRAGKKGIAITLVDWDDINRWKMINKTLELDFDEPLETYSSSPHIFEDLEIPKDAKGSLSRKTEPRGQESKPGSAPNQKKSRRRTRSYNQSKPSGK